MSSIEMPRIVDELNLEQRTGIFEVPEVIESDTGIKRWRNKLLKTLGEVPLVVQEESYYRWGVRTKLRSSNKFICDKISHYGLLRPLEGSDFSYHVNHREPVSTLSIAQFISWVVQKPIEQILFSEEEFHGRTRL